MARGHREMILEQRHLLGVFFGVVLFCAISFAVGYVLGRGRGEEDAAKKYASMATALEKSPGSASEQLSSQPGAGDLSFYDRVGEKQPKEKLAASNPKSAPATTSVSRPKQPAQTASQPAARSQGAAARSGKPIHIQVGAFTEEGQARRLAEQLEKLGFPALVRASASDRFYRVLVGPFINPELADAADRRLAAHGFRTLRR